MGLGREEENSWAGAIREAEMLELSPSEDGKRGAPAWKLHRRMDMLAEELQQGIG